MKRKITALFLLTSIGIISFLSMGTPGLAKANNLRQAIGHSFAEDGWSILYDAWGGKVEQDYNPGPYADDITDGTTDNNTDIDMKFFIAYTNYHGVQTAYLALQNFSWDVDSDLSLYGCAPYQVLLQHFKPIGYDDLHCFVVNRFLGLLAYRDVAGGTEGLPDDTDNLYLGWGFRSEWHKALFNWLLKNNSITETKYLFSENKKCTATPIALTEEGNTYKYGIKYENLFVLWQTIATEGLDDTVTKADIVKWCTAVGLLDELTFTYVISYEEIEGGKLAVSTTVEYDIGRFSKGWITDDTQATADKYGGERFALTNPAGRSMTFYDEDHIPARLEGDSDTAGLSLAVINTANLFTVNSSKAVLKQVEDQNFGDQDGEDIGSTTEGINYADYDIANDPTYKIDFAGKPKYTWNGTEELDSPTRVLKNGLVKVGFDWIGAFSNVLLGLYVADVTNNFWAGVQSLARFDQTDFFYLTCFPKWSGATINQDPTFTAYVVSDITSGRRIPGYDLMLIGLVGIATFTYGIHHIRKKLV